MNALKVVKKNTLTKKSGVKGSAQAGLIVPFYARFVGKGGGTAGPPRNWLTRK